MKNTTEVAGVVASRALSSVAQAGCMVLLARSVTTNEFGTFATVLAVLFFTGTTLEFGVDTLCSRMVAEGKWRDAAQVSGLHLVLIIATGATATATLTIGALFWHGLWGALVALPIVVILERRLSFRLNNLIAMGQPNRGILPLVGGRGIGLVVMTALILLEYAPLWAYAIGVAIGAASSLLLLRREKHVSTTISLRGMPVLTSQARHYWAATLSGQLRGLDVAVIALLATPSVVAVYALPARAIAPIRLLGTSVAAVAFPLATRRELERLRRLNNGVACVASGTVAVALVLFPFMTNAISAVLGPQYVGAGSVLRVFFIGIGANIMGSVLSSELQGFGDSRFIAAMGVWLVVVFFFALALGAYWSGALGAAWGVTAAFVIQLGAVGVRIRKQRYLG